MIYLSCQTISFTNKIDNTLRKLLNLLSYIKAFDITAAENFYPEIFIALYLLNFLRNMWYKKNAKFFTVRKFDYDKLNIYIHLACLIINVSHK